jgi:hypothetical protein
MYRYTIEISGVKKQEKRISESVAQRYVVVDIAWAPRFRP